MRTVSPVFPAGGNPADRKGPSTMSYFADSAWQYVRNSLETVRQQQAGRRVLITVPQLPEAEMIALAETFQRNCITDDVDLTLKVAEALWKRWEDPAAQKKAQAQGWLDTTGSLTSWRNLAPQSRKTSLVVLCGADCVTDSGSLSDFLQCDVDTIWNVQMRRSFSDWVQKKLSTVPVACDDRDLKGFDDLLVPLLEQGTADLLQIGKWLSTLDLRSASSPQEVQEIMLDKLGCFGLPRMTGFLDSPRTKELGHYIREANEFFLYTKFLDERSRENAIKAIDNLVASLQESIQPEEVQDIRLHEERVRGVFPTGQDMLTGLRKYVSSEDPLERERLLHCDFVTIADRILRFKNKIKPKSDKATLLQGGPVEVVLHALWLTLRDFYRENSREDGGVHEIQITADRFRHDYESGSDDEDSAAVVDRTEWARDYLTRLLGGVDDLVEKRVLLSNASGGCAQVTCRLADDRVPCVYSATAEPRFEFSIKLIQKGTQNVFTNRFAWRLPDIQPYRLAVSLIGWARDELEASPILPVFHVPYYHELFQASDDEETRRVLLHCIQDASDQSARHTNLLSREWNETPDPLLPHLSWLAAKYRDFVSAAHEGGLHRALFGDKWGELRKAYAAACRAVTEQTHGTKSRMTAMLMRCFLIVEQRNSSEGIGWYGAPFERSAVVTVFHPAVLEMLEAQVLFLFSSFNAAARQELAREERKDVFADRIWTGYVDLASLRAPLVGLLHDEGLSLDTAVAGQDLIHRVGSPPKTEASLSTRVLVRYDTAADEEDVPDSGMLRDTRESRLLSRLMIEYFDLHPHARDGLKLAVLRNRDIQPVIAAVHQYLEKLADNKDTRRYVLSPDRRKPYAIGVTLFTDSDDAAGVARWIEQWREFWEQAETERSFEMYRHCRFSLAHRILEARRPSSFEKMIRDGFESDIAVLYDFIGDGGNHFVEVTPFDITDRTLKFPILQKSCCAIRHPSERDKRYRVISNRQFVLGSLHAQVMHLLRYQVVQPGKEFAVLGVGDFAPWRKVMDALHKASEWVVCVDPSMDERLVKTTSGGGRQREIIGFGSGVGTHGESNYTVSTEQFFLEDVRVRLAASIGQVYSRTGWSEEVYKRIAEGILHEACQISGLSLVRATGAGDCHIRDFMAYALTRKMLREENILCDAIVSLDAYAHWFGFAENGSRPDLVWLTVRSDEEGPIRVSMRLIECKLCEQSESEQRIRTAHGQIANGFRVLIPAFAPRSPGETLLSEDERPDRRYWWLQLHRLIATRAEIDSGQEGDIMSRLDRLAEGDYVIDWGAAVFVFQTDDNSEKPRRIQRGTMSLAVATVTADVFALGAGFVRGVAEGTAAACPMTWAEWQSGVRDAPGLTCVSLDDIEPPPDQEEEDDTDLDLDTAGSTRKDQAQPEAIPEPSGTVPVPHGGGTTSGATAPQEREKPPVVVPGATTVSDETNPERVTPPRILLGKTVTGSPVFWEFWSPDLENRHMVVFGTSGMGKTYAIQCILCELARANQNSLVIDYTDGFTPSKLESATKGSLKPTQHYIYKSPLPINPFKPQSSYEDNVFFEERPLEIAKRVAAVFRSVYELGDQQFSVLIDAFHEGLQRDAVGFTLERALRILERYVEDRKYSPGTVKTTISKLKQFIHSRPFADHKDDLSWTELFEDQSCRCHVFQFHMVDPYSARAVIEFILWDLYSVVSSRGDKNTPRVVVLDEVQNLDLGPDAPVSKCLTEGRKHGLALITATQTVRGVGGANDARVSRLFQSGHKLFFRPTDNEMQEHARLLYNATHTCNVDEWIRRLASLSKGECWSVGRCQNDGKSQLSLQAQRIRITSLEERGFHE